MNTDCIYLRSSCTLQRLKCTDAPKYCNKVLPEQRCLFTFVIEKESTVPCVIWKPACLILSTHHGVQAIVFAKKKKRSFLMSEKGIRDHHWRDTAFLMWKSEQIFTFWLRVSVCCNSPPKHKTALLNMRFSWVFQDFQLHLI